VKVDSKAMLRRLSEEEDIVVIDRPDFSSQNLRRYLPDVARYVDTEFEIVTTIGDYRVIRKRRL